MQFFDSIFENGLYDYNKEYYDKEFDENFRKTIHSINVSFKDIEENTKLNLSTEEQMEIFKIITFVNFINMNLETVKKYLKMMIKKGNDGIKFDENTTLGQMIKRICDKIGYSGKTKESIFDLFCVDFRNAIAHQHYLVFKNGITIYPKESSKRKDFDQKSLGDLGMHVTGLYNAINKFGNNRGNEKVVELKKLRKKFVKENNSIELLKLDKAIKHFQKLYPQLDW